MLRERERVIERGSVIFQAFLSMGCFYIAWLINSVYIQSDKEGLREYQIIFILILPIWYVLIDHFGLGRMARTRMYSNIFFEYFSVVSIGSALMFITIGVLEMRDISRWVLVIYVVMNFIVLFSYKVLAYKSMKILRGRGYNLKHVLIIADKDSYHFIDKIIETKDWGYKIRFIVSNCSSIQNNYNDKYAVIDEPDMNSLSDLIDKTVVDEVMYCKGDFNQDKIRELVNSCAEVGVTFRMQSEFLNLTGGRSYLSYFNQLPFLTFMSTPNNYLALKLKCLMDYVGAFLILMAISPVLMCIAIAIKLDDGGPVFV